MMTEFDEDMEYEEEEEEYDNYDVPDRIWDIFDTITRIQETSYILPDAKKISLQLLHTFINSHNHLVN